MAVAHRRFPTSAHERTVARTMQPDFGGIEDDQVDVPAALAQQAVPVA